FPPPFTGEVDCIASAMQDGGGIFALAPSASLCSARPPFSGEEISSVIGRLELGEVELLHRHHRLGHLLDALGVARSHQLAEFQRHDLPRQPELVLEPAAGAFFAALGQRIPVVIDFSLGAAADGQRHRFAELVDRPAVQRDELHAVEFEGDDHHGSGRHRPGFAIVRHALDLRILEDAGIEVRRFFRLRVEPQAGRDSLHVALLPYFGGGPSIIVRITSSPGPATLRKSLACCSSSSFESARSMPKPLPIPSMAWPIPSLTMNSLPLRRTRKPCSGARKPPPMMNLPCWLAMRSSIFFLISSDGG